MKKAEDKSKECKECEIPLDEDSSYPGCSDDLMFTNGGKMMVIAILLVAPPLYIMQWMYSRVKGLFEDGG